MRQLLTREEALVAAEAAERYPRGFGARFLALKTVKSIRAEDAVNALEAKPARLKYG